MERTTFGQYLHEARVNRGMTQAQLAVELQVGAPFLSKLEADKEQPSDYLVTRLAQVVRLDPYLLFLLLGRVPLEVMEVMQQNFAETLAQWRKLVKA